VAEGVEGPFIRIVGGGEIDVDAMLVIQLDKFFALSIWRWIKCQGNWEVKMQEILLVAGPIQLLWPLEAFPLLKASATRSGCWQPDVAE
jgi:hypothetical protein